MKENTFVLKRGRKIIDKGVCTTKPVNGDFLETVFEHPVNMRDGDRLSFNGVYREGVKK